MIELNIDKIKESREYAKHYFPGFFLSKKQLNRTITYNTEKLKDDYIDYLEENFSKPLSELKKEGILKGKDYINELLEMSEKEGAILGRLWQEYINLNNMIATYVYGPIEKYDWGSEKKEHEINEQILTQLALFEPLVYTITMDLRGRSKDKNKLNSLIKDISSSKDILWETGTTYKKQRGIIALKKYDEEIKSLWPAIGQELGQREVSLSELGKSRVMWHKARNNACSTLLHTVKELVDMDISVHLGISNYLALEEKPQLDKKRQQIVNYYLECMDMLKHSNNYFCYLDEKEKNKLAEAKKLRKQISRGIVTPTKNN